MEFYRLKSNTQTIIGSDMDLSKYDTNDLVSLNLKKEDMGWEKHVPFAEKVEDGYKVRCGEKVPHVMQEDHYIDFMQISVDGKLSERIYLDRNGKAEATFKVPHGKEIIAYAYCNLHGLWTNK